jgi:hypothetical protein
MRAGRRKSASESRLVRQQITAMVLKNAVGAVSIGVLIGLPAAWAAAQWCDRCCLV